MAAAPASLPALNAIPFDALVGWSADDLGSAFAVFRRGAAVLADHPPKARALGVDVSALTDALNAAAALPADVTADAARAFFEATFRPLEVSAEGFFTGYYEPEVAGSLTPDARFHVPLYRAPDDLTEVPPGAEPAYADRGEIMAGALAGRGLELAYLASAIDAFFVHVQGACRVKLPDGRVMRITYSGKTGHAYTPIGRVLIDTGALAPGNVTMQTIRAWLAAHPDEAPAVMAKNRSYIFFREADATDPDLGPIAAAKVPLTAGRSLAVDRLLWSFHVPVWIETTLPDGTPFRRLMVAQDTGSAIVGPTRGDLFFGSGDAAGEIAGAMRAPGRFVVFAPRGGVAS